jgi:hypothetical protein
MKGDHFVVDDGNDAVDGDRLAGWPGLRRRQPDQAD